MLFIRNIILAYGVLIYLDCRFFYLFLSIFGLSGLGDLSGILGPFLRLRTLVVSFGIVNFVYKLRSGLGGAGLNVCDSKLLGKC